MSMVTMTLDNMSKLAAPNAKTLEERINTFIPWLFNFSVPWYLNNNAGLQEWERMFVIKYWEREIAFDTVVMFQLKLWELLAQKIPYYRLLADQMGLIGNIFINVDETTAGKETETDNIIGNVIKNVDELIKNNGYVDTDSVSTSKTTDIGDSEKTEKGSVENEEVEKNTTETNKNDKVSKSLTENETHSDVSTKNENKTGQDIHNNATSQTTNTVTDGTEGRTETGSGTNNSQGLTSDNPQITIATQDYANSLSRNESIISDNKTMYATNNGYTGTTISGSDSGGVSSSEYTSESVGSSGKSDKSGIETTDNNSTGTTTVDGSKTGTSSESRTANETFNNVSSTDSNDTTTQTTKSDNNRNLSDKTDTKETKDRLSDRETNVKGWRGSRSDEFRRFAESVKNINEMLLDDCAVLFLGILPNPFMDTFPFHILGG